METYTVKTPARVEYTDSLLGSIRASFEKGDVEPKNEHELVALQILVRRGAAKVKAEKAPTIPTVEEEN